MRKVVFLFLGYLLITASSQAQTEEDFERVNNEAFEAFESYNYRTAIDKEHVLLKWLKKPKQKNDTNEVIVYLNLGGFYQSYQEYDSAHTCLEMSRKLCERYFGKQNEYYINIVLQLGGFYEAIELLPEAEVINEDAIEQIAKGATQDPWLIGAIYSNQAIVKKKLFKLKEGIALVEKSERLTERSSGRKSLDFANLLNTKALLYGYMGERKLEEKLLLEAMSICQDLKATEKSLYSTLLNNMATLYSEKGDYNSAIRYYEISYRIKAGIYTEKSLECALVQSNEGISLGNAGKYNQGIQMIQRSRRIVEDLLGKFHPEWFERCLNLGLLYDRAGMFNEANDLYATTIDQAKQELGEKSGVYISILNNAAEYYTRRNEYDKSSRYYGVLIKNLDVVSEDYQLTIQGNYANFLNQTGRWKEAEPLYKKVVDGWEELVGNSSQEYLLAKHNMGVFYQDLGQLTEAKNLLLATKETLLKVAGPKTPLMLTLNENLAGIYKEEKDYAKALAIYQDLLEIRQGEYGEESIDVGDLLGKIAMCYTNLYQPDQAQKYMEQAYSMKVKLVGKDDPRLSYETSLLATTYTYSGNFRKGVEYYEESKRLIANEFSTYFRFMTEKEKLEFLGTKMSELKQLQAIAVENGAKYEGFADLALEVELMMKGMVLESGNQVKQAVLKSKDPKVSSKYKQWQDLRTQLAVELVKPEINRRKDFNELQTKAQELEREILTTLAVQDPMTLSDYSLKELKKKLGKEEVLIEFISYKSFMKEEDWVGAIVLSSTMEHPKLVPLFTEAKMNAYLQARKKANEQGLVSTLYGEKRGVSDLDDEMPVLGDDSLYLMLWKPLEGLLTNAKTLYYSPSGSIHKIALAALRDMDGKYLSEKYQMITLSSGRKLTETRSELKLSDAYLVGGIDYNLSPSIIAKKVQLDAELPQFAMRGGNGARAWSYLAGTKTEVEQIAKIVGEKRMKVQLETGEEPYEEEVKKKMEQGPSIIHLSTHGYFFPTPTESSKENVNVYQSADNPLLRSGLILAGANSSWTGEEIPKGLDDGILTAYEVATMDLSATKLAVLSACQTGLGDVQGSEGVFGLQRAFKQAGVEYVMMSLWQVPDKETVEFMTLFYTQLAEGHEIEVAFNGAQKIMREKYDPYYWAAFVLIR